MIYFEVRRRSSPSSGPAYRALCLYQHINNPCNIATFMQTTLTAELNFYTLLDSLIIFLQHIHINVLLSPSIHLVTVSDV